MFKTKRLFIIIAGSMLSIIFASSNAHAIDDTDSINDSDTMSSGNFEVKITDRDNNALNIKVLPADISKFSKHDCVDDVSMNFEVTLTGDAAGSHKTTYLYAGDDCNLVASIANCVKLDQIIPTSNKLTFTNISLSTIFDPIDCNSEGTESMQLWLAMLETEDVIDRDADDMVERAVLIKLKTSIPATTVDNVDYTIGDSGITLNWDKVDDSAVKGYAAFYVTASDSQCADGSLTEGSLVDPDQIDGSESSLKNSKATSIKITGLTNGEFYQIAVSTLDEYGNTSVLSEPVCASPAPTKGFGSGLDVDSGYCFIATAAFGSYDHPTVKVLRIFRDKFLAHLPGGNAFISAYYSVGPYLAKIIKNRPQLKRATVAALSLFAGLSTLLVQIGAFRFMAGLLFVLLFGLILGFATPGLRNIRSKK